MKSDTVGRRATFELESINNIDSYHPSEEWACGIAKDRIVGVALGILSLGIGLGAFCSLYSASSTFSYLSSSFATGCVLSVASITFLATSFFMLLRKTELAPKAPIRSQSFQIYADT